MLRALPFLLALLSLSAPASSETPPKPVDAQSTSILATPRKANRLLQSISAQKAHHSTSAAGPAARSVRSAKPAAIPASRGRRPATSVRDARAMDELLASTRPKATGSPRMKRPNATDAHPLARRPILARSADR